MQFGVRRMNYSQVHLQRNQLPSLEKDFSFSRSRLPVAQQYNNLLWFHFLVFYETTITRKRRVTFLFAIVVLIVIAWYLVQTNSIILFSPSRYTVTFLSAGYFEKDFVVNMGQRYNSNDESLFLNSLTHYTQSE